MSVVKLNIALERQLSKLAVAASIRRQSQTMRNHGSRIMIDRVNNRLAIYHSDKCYALCGEEAADIVRSAEHQAKRLRTVCAEDIILVDSIGWPNDE